MSLYWWSYDLNGHYEGQTTDLVRAINLIGEVEYLGERTAVGTIGVYRPGSFIRDRGSILYKTGEYNTNIVLSTPQGFTLYALYTAKMAYRCMRRYHFNIHNSNYDYQRVAGFRDMIHLIITCDRVYTKSEIQHTVDWIKEGF